MERPVEIHPDAAEKLQQAIDWHEGRFQGLGLDLLIEVGRGIEMIGERPLAWPRHIRGTRRFLLHRFPYGIVYRQKKEVLRILAVMHLHRRPGYWTDRKTGV